VAALAFSQHHARAMRPTPTPGDEHASRARDRNLGFGARIGFRSPQRWPCTATRWPPSAIVPAVRSVYRAKIEHKRVNVGGVDAWCAPAAALAAAVSCWTSAGNVPRRARNRMPSAA
jgi:hypothetical protein